MTLESFFLLFRPLFVGTAVVLTIVGGVALAMPDEVAKTLGLLHLRETHRSEFGLSLSVGISTVVAVQFSDT
jgi:hypothetical protein